MSICKLEGNGYILYQHPTLLYDNFLDAYHSLYYIARSLRASKEIYVHFGYFGDIKIGYTLCGVENIRLGFPPPFFPRTLLISKRPTLFIQKIVKYDEFLNGSKLLFDIFQELFRCFKFVPEEKELNKIVDDIIKNI